MMTEQSAETVRSTCRFGYTDHTGDESRCTLPAGHEGDHFSGTFWWQHDDHRTTQYDGPRKPVHDWGDCDCEPLDNDGQREA